MRSRISIRGCVRPSVRRSVGRSVGPSVRHTRVAFLRNRPNLNKIASGIRKYAIKRRFKDKYASSSPENASVVRTLFDLFYELHAFHDFHPIARALSPTFSPLPIITPQAYVVPSTPPASSGGDHAPVTCLSTQKNHVSPRPSPPPIPKMFIAF